jgi:hypothetical protein
MKKILFPVIVLVLSALIGCSEKIKVAAPYKDITVIYGLLDQRDTAHYVRIQKAFLDNDKSAVNMAKVPDSSFYSNISVRVNRYKAFGLANTYIDSIHLNRVDLNLEGYPKQPGIFFQAPNYAYKFTDALDPRYFYRIVVTNLVTGARDSADAPVIDDLNAAVFNVPVLDDSSTNQSGLNFVMPKKFFEVTGAYYNPGGYNFFGQYSPAGLSQLIIRFNWWDTSAGTPKTYHSTDYNAGYYPMGQSAGFAYRIDNQQLVFALRDGMGPAPANTIRLLDRSDIFVYLSTPDYYTYYQVALTSGTGLTGSEIAPIYTNVKGNALGLFTSRGSKSGKITITTKTVDSLVHNPILSSTNLRGTIY